MSRLEDAGAIEVQADGRVAAVDPSEPVNTEDIVGRAAAAQEDREQFDRSRVEMIRGYAEIDDGCRRDFVLSYFAEEFHPPCGRCDNCDAGRVGERPADAPFASGDRVVHARWGTGVVQRVEQDQILVLFDAVGYKQLGVELVQQRGLLESEEAA